MQVGDKIGKLEVLELRVKKRNNGVYYHLCRCDCGNKKAMKEYNIKNSKGCGCGAKEKTAGIENGQTYGKWTVIREYSRKSSKNRNWYHLCQCECGNHQHVLGGNLKMGKSNQCMKCSVESEDTLQNKIFRAYKSSAKDRGHSFDLDLTYFLKEIDKPCHYCGAKNSRTTSTYHKDESKRRHLLSNGLDRVDNNIGYTEENCVPCCTTCNSMKMCLGKDEFLTHIQKIYDFNH